MSVNPLSIKCPVCRQLPGMNCVAIQTLRSSSGNIFERHLGMNKPHKARVKAAKAYRLNEMVHRKVS